MASTVMLADDDPVLLGDAADALRGAGFKVVEAADGQRALQEALSRKVDLIVMDASMPEVSGVEACHCLKAMPKTHKIPVVLTAAKKDPAARALGQRTHGSVRVLRKPFSPDELVSMARELVRPRSLL
ncbi:MAG: response regulator [Actinomycetota bacterium]|jgi:CheY-like chemotaxis protein|nr:response regulator [Actinomycetota bacterium]MDQ4000733.1 response regulator [Actinomycetota bacterium]MDQ4083718.1 response regulator [Actinomycetota bacterium]